MNKIAGPFNIILRVTLIISIKYLSILLDIVKKDKVGGNKYKRVRKSRNKIVKILAKPKSWNLPKLKFENLFKHKKV